MLLLIETSMTSLEIIQPDDFHHHLRDGEVLVDTVGKATEEFRRVIAMPNLQPPVTNLAAAIAYRERIMQYADSRFNPLMTLFLSDATTPEIIEEAFSSGLVYAVKLYPAGATTNSHNGVTDLAKLHSVFEKMSDIQMPLLIHGEINDPAIEMFDREEAFINTTLRPFIAKYPRLKIVLEHATTACAVKFIEDHAATHNIAATITVHHLMYSRDSVMINGSINQYMYCLPILKHESDRQALLRAATSGNPRFFIGTDSAPHSVVAKETTCCAGIFTAHAAIELYAEVFESQNALDKLENFCSVFGQQFYGIPVNDSRITLIREDWTVPETYRFGSSEVRPLKSDEVLHWKIKGKKY